MVKTDESMVEAKAWWKCLRDGLDLLLPPLPFLEKPVFIREI
jgi:hypothetical protein